MDKLSRILVAVDGSAGADRAFESAVKLAKQLGSKLYAVSVVDMPSMLEIDKETARALNAKLVVGAKTLLSKYHADTNLKHGIEIETILAHGYPSRAIIDMAKEKDIDLIVIGSRGLSGIKSLFLGSVSQEVVRSAKQAVLVVR